MKIFSDVSSLAAATLTADQIVKVKSVGDYRIQDSGAGITLANGKIAVPQASGTAISVKQFGATGDGVTDDTAAIQAALDSTAKDIYFPEGSYAVSSKLVQDRSLVRIRGAGKHSTEIKPLASFDRVTYDCLMEVGTASTSDHVVQGIAFQAVYNSNGNDLSGLAISAAYNVDLLDCKFKSGNYVTRINGGLLIRTGKHTRIQNCHFHNGYCYGVVINAHGNGLNFINCAFDECSVNMISTGNILEMTVTGCEFGQAIANATYPTPVEKRQIDLLVGSHARIVLDGNSFSGSATTEYAFLLSNVEQTIINGNMFSGNTRYAIVHNGSKDCTITGNAFANNGTDTGTTDPSVGLRNYETTTFCSDIYKYSAFAQPFSMTGNISDITDRPMSWIEGTGSSLSTSQSTIIGNNCSGGASYIHKTNVTDTIPLINGKRYNSVTQPVEITIPAKTYNAGQIQFGNVSVTGVATGDVVCLAPKTSSELTPGLCYFGTVNATNQVRWSMVNATTGTIVEPDRTFVVSVIKA